MKTHLKKISYVIVLIVGLSITASAQKKDKVPRKEKPPIIVPKKKKGKLKIGNERHRKKKYKVRLFGVIIKK